MKQTETPKTGDLVIFAQHYADGAREHSASVVRVIDANSILVRQNGLDTMEPGWGELLLIDAAQIVTETSYRHAAALA